MKKRFFGLTLAVTASVLSVAALASCGKKGVANAGEKFEVISVDELKGEPVVVEFWHSFGDKIEKPLTQLIENFEAEMKEQGFNIEVNVTNKGGGYDGLRSAVNLGTSSNAIPTMILGYPDHFADYINNKILLPLDAYVYADDETIALDGVKKDGANDFIPSYWAENQMVVDGKKQTVGIPFNKSTEIMTYNSNMVDPILVKLSTEKPELGFTLEGEGEALRWLNPTWDQVFAVSKYIKENKDTLTYEYKNASYNVSKDMKYPVYIDSEANFFITTSRQWGGEGKYTEVDAQGAGTVTAWNDSNKDAQVNYFLPKALNDKLFQFPKKENQNYGSKLLVNRQAFITIGSTAGIKNNASQSYYLKATGIPQKSYGEGANNAVIQQGTNLAILTQNSNNKTRLASWLLIKYLTKTESTEYFSTETGYMPVRQSARDSETFKAMLANEKDPFTGTVARAINAAFSQVDYFYTDTAFKSSSIVRDKADTLVQDMYIYNKTFDQAMKAFYGELETLNIKTKKLVK